VSNSILHRNLKRRTFLTGIGSAAVLVSSCGATKDSSNINSIENQIDKIIQEKQELIIDAQGLLASNPELSSPLQVLIDQNSAHIEALAKYSPSTEQASPSPSSPQAIDLSALTTRCAVLSTNHLNTACRLADAEISRVVSLIAGSEMQHHALLTGYIA
jgi:hypothetical protein